MFICINFIELIEIMDVYNINLYYSFADLISKLMTVIIITDHYEIINIDKNKMDLQSLQFTSYIIKNIDKYEHNNVKITKQCNDFIYNTKKYFIKSIPDNKIVLKDELINKILPLGIVDEYLLKDKYILERRHIIDSIITPIVKTLYKQKTYDNICVLFTDIVGYTTIAGKYDHSIIFKLLNDIYTKFDIIIEKYTHLQKIETIGDAYMITGDIFKDLNKDDNIEIVIIEMILFSFEILNEIKTIRGPGNEELSIRIGLNIGSVSIGVLGNNLPRLCVVGDAVNYSARLQSNAYPDSILMSEDVNKYFLDNKSNNFFTKYKKKYKVVKIKEDINFKNIGKLPSFSIKYSSMKFNKIDINEILNTKEKIN
jgi:atrial natriuretic peptide receptor A